MMHSRPHPCPLPAAGCTARVFVTLRASDAPAAPDATLLEHTLISYGGLRGNGSISSDYQSRQFQIPKTRLLPPAPVWRDEDRASPRANILLSFSPRSTSLSGHRHGQTASCPATVTAIMTTILDSAQTTSGRIVRSRSLVIRREQAPFSCSLCLFVGVINVCACFFLLGGFALGARKDGVAGDE